LNKLNRQVQEHGDGDGDGDGEHRQNGFANPRTICPLDAYKCYPTLQPWTSHDL